MSAEKPTSTAWSGTRSARIFSRPWASSSARIRRIAAQSGCRRSCSAVRAWACSMAATRSPKAERTPGAAGTITVSIASSSASATPWTGPAPAPAGAGGAGVGAGALRPDAEAAGGVEPGDAAAPRPDRVDVDHRHPDRVAGDGARLADEGGAGLNEGDVGAGTPDVDRDDVAVPGGLRGVERPHDAGGRAGQDQRHRARRRHAGPGDAAPRVHDLGVRRDPQRPERVVEPAEVAGADRAQVGV